jgi:hypothetical protein
MPRSQLEDYRLTDGEQEALARYCANGVADLPSGGQARLVELAGDIGSRAPELVGLREFASGLVAGSTKGLGLVRGAPSVDHPALLGAIVASTMGRIVRFEGAGDYLTEIKEDPGGKTGRPSFANAREFFLHTDLTFVPSPPSFFAMQSVVNYPDEGGISVFCDIDEAVAGLDAICLERLQAADFLFTAPAHYKGTSVVTFPILTRADTGDWRVRFRRDNLRARTRGAIAAVVDLVEALSHAAFEVMLDAGTVALIPNDRVLHGRTAFVGARDRATPRPARHLNRMYVRANRVRAR